MSKHAPEPVGWIGEGELEKLKAGMAIETGIMTRVTGARSVPLYDETQTQGINPEAASDLLELVKALLEHGSPYYGAIELYPSLDGREWAKKARTAIAKAEVKK